MANVYCTAKKGYYPLTETCGAKAKYYAESLCQDGSRKPLCGTHANKWRRAGHHIVPISANPTSGDHER